jgi:hypothetical protein
LTNKKKAAILKAENSVASKITQNTGISNDNSDVSDDDLSSASGGVTQPTSDHRSPEMYKKALEKAQSDGDFVGGPGSYLPEGFKKP